jgi:enoyl-CoA hydratase
VTPPSVTIERVEPHITQLTLNRPDRLNAITFGLVGELHDALDEIGADPECKVIVLTGAGRAFCSGLDLRDWGTPPAAGEHRHVDANTDGQMFMSNLTVHMRATPQVIIAAVKGPAFGGGLAIACAADLRFAGESARFCSAFIRTGLSGTDIGITYLLPRLIGASRAFDMILTGREVDAAESERLGIVSRVVPDDQVLDEAMATARIMAGYTKSGLITTKEVLWHNVDATSMTAAIALEARNQMLVSAAPDVREHMAGYRTRTTGGS